MAEVSRGPQERVRYFVEVVWNKRDYRQLHQILDPAYFLINPGKLGDRDAVTKGFITTRFVINSIGQLQYQNDSWVGCQVTKQDSTKGTEASESLVFILTGAPCRIKDIKRLDPKKVLTHFAWSEYIASSGNYGELDTYLGILSEAQGVFSGQNASSWARRHGELERLYQVLFGVTMSGQPATASAAVIAPIPASLRDMQGAVAARSSDEESGALEQYLRTNLPKWPITESLVHAATELIALRQAAPIAERVGVPGSMTQRIEEETTSAIEALGRSATLIAAVGAQNIDSERVIEALAREATKLDNLARAIFGAREGLAELTLTGPEPNSLEQAELGFRKIGEAASEILSRNGASSRE